LRKILRISGSGNREKEKGGGGKCSVKIISAERWREVPSARRRKRGWQRGPGVAGGAEKKEMRLTAKTSR